MSQKLVSTLLQFQCVLSDVKEKLQDASYSVLMFSLVRYSTQMSRG